MDGFLYPLSTIAVLSVPLLLPWQRYLFCAVQIITLVYSYE